MKLPIYSTWTKFCVLFVLLMLFFLLIFTFFALGIDLPMIPLLLGMLGAVYLATRFFRADGESPAPRPWWRVHDTAQEAINLVVYMTVVLIINLLTRSGHFDMAMFLIYLPVVGLSLYNYRKLKKIGYQAKRAL